MKDAFERSTRSPLPAQQPAGRPAAPSRPDAGDLEDLLAREVAAWDATRALIARARAG